MNNIKYNFHDFLYKGIPLPVDINSEVEQAVAGFKSEELNSIIKNIRERHLFGDVHFCLLGIMEPLAKINFSYGMCLRYVLISKNMDSYAETKKRIKAILGVDPVEEVYFFRSIYNRKITKYKPKKGD